MIIQSINDKAPIKPFSGARKPSCFHRLPLLRGRFIGSASADDAGTTDLFATMPLIFDAIGSTARELCCDFRPTVRGINEERKRCHLCDEENHIIQ